MDTAAPPFFPARFTCTSRWSQGAHIDVAALALLLLAALALFRFKLGVIPVIAGCALAGLLLRVAGLA